MALTKIRNNRRGRRPGYGATLLLLFFEEGFTAAEVDALAEDVVAGAASQPGVKTGTS